MSDTVLGWQHEVELVDGASVGATRTLFPNSDTTNVAATSSFIVVSSLLLYILQHHIPRKDSAAPPRRATPFLMHLALILDFAIEYPLILAFHPATLAFPRDPFRISQAPALPSLLAQVAVCMTIESACERAFSRLIANFPKDDPALLSTIAFVRPRAAILLACGMLGVPSVITAATGRLHATSMAVWILAQQFGGGMRERKAA